jgi:uroporphyrinogen decarboxylase
MTNDRVQATAIEHLTARDRILIAMRRGVPDRVPVMPDISNMVPARLTGKPFWDIYLYNDPPLDEAYLNAVDHFGFDGWYIYDNATMLEQPAWHQKIIEKGEDEIKVERWIETPHGRLSETTGYPVKDSPWVIEGMVKDVAADFPKLQWYMQQRSLDSLFKNRSKIGEKGIFGIAIETFMGFWVWARNGGSMQAILDITEEPDLMRPVLEFYLQYASDAARYITGQHPDEILLAGSSSSLSLSSPRIYKQYDLPIVKAVSRICKEADVICHQHTCGKSRLIVEINYAETDVNVMEPLERDPGGDVDLAEVKQKFGDKFCLKGNVNTFETMINGTPEDVEREAKACIDAAASGGGFILATGDQCGRDTPDENIFKLVEVAQTYGKYDREKTA